MCWIRLDRPGQDQCTLSGTTLTGCAEWQGEEGPGALGYLVKADAGWRTTAVAITGTLQGAPVDLRIVPGGWTVNGVTGGVSADVTDIDLFFTPATNTLPIRRLMKGGIDRAEVTAAWLTPDLTLRPLRQSYTRLAPDRWMYESPDHDYRAELTVDPQGLVREYSGLWTEAR